MRGPSASGKSTRAREIASRTGAVIVSRDELRHRLLGRSWSAEVDTADEERVSRAEGELVVALLSARKSVIVDNVHLNPAHLRDWAFVAALMGAKFEVVDVSVPVETCIAQDRERARRGERSVGDAEIRRQAALYGI